MTTPATMNHPESDTSTALLDRPSENRRTATTSDPLDGAFHPAQTPSGRAFPAETRPTVQTSMLRRNNSNASPFDERRLDSLSQLHPHATSNQIMQQAVTHQGLERVFDMYNLLSTIVRRVAGTLAIKQKARD